MKNVKFSKYQGLGNDFVVIDCRQEDSIESLLNKSSKFISNICDRHFGIGADGVIFVLNSTNNSNVRMRIINSDSSEPEMCGNGVRCLVKYLLDEDESNDLCNKELQIETLAGTIKATYDLEELIEISMGVPSLEPSRVPTTLNVLNNGLAEGSILISDSKYQIFAVGMGNPHLITYVKTLSDIQFEKMGTLLENCTYFPNRTNVHFVKVIDKKTIEMVVWERGCGLTLACGTGACAVVVASCVLGLTDRKVKVKLPGGNLNITWPSNNSSVFMKGPAHLSFKGILNLDNYHA